MRRVVVIMMAALAALTALTTGGLSAAHAAGPVSAKDDPSGAALDKLLSWIPSESRYTCYAIKLDDYFNKIDIDDTGVKCDHPGDGVTSVIYVLAKSQKDAEHLYSTSISADLPETKAPADDACETRFLWNFDKSVAGNAACFTGDDGARMVWTGNASHIYAFADGPDAASVRAWWNTKSGPTQTPAKITDFGANTPKASKAATKALTADIGAQVKCKSSLDLVSPGHYAWAFYVWIDAAVNCTGPQDGNIVLVKINPKSAAAYYADFVPSYVVDTQTPSTPDGCAEQDLLNTNDKPVGKISCVTAGGNTTATWYNTETGVLGSVQLNVSPDDLYTYLSDNKLL